MNSGCTMPGDRPTPHAHGRGAPTGVHSRSRGIGENANRSTGARRCNTPPHVILARVGTAPAAEAATAPTKAVTAPARSECTLGPRCADTLGAVLPAQIAEVLSHVATILATRVAAALLELLARDRAVAIGLTVVADVAAIVAPLLPHVAPEVAPVLPHLRVAAATLPVAALPVVPAVRATVAVVDVDACAGVIKVVVPAVITGIVAAEPAARLIGIAVVARAAVIAVAVKAITIEAAADAHVHAAVAVPVGARAETQPKAAE